MVNIRQYNTGVLEVGFLTSKTNYLVIFNLNATVFLLQQCDIVCHVILDAIQNCRFGWCFAKSRFGKKYNINILLQRYDNNTI